MPFYPTPPEDSSPEVPEDIRLLQTVLPPLLDDFQHWFSRSADLLEAQSIDFLSPEQQQVLRSQVRSAQKQVSAAQALAAATEGKAGIDMPVVMSWHKLVHECWGIALRLRRENSGNPQSGHPSI